MDELLSIALLQEAVSLRFVREPFALGSVHLHFPDQVAEHPEFQRVGLHGSCRQTLSQVLQHSPAVRDLFVALLSQLLVRFNEWRVFLDLLSLSLA